MKLVKPSLTVLFMLNLMALNLVGQASPPAGAGGGQQKSALPQRYDQNDSIAHVFTPDVLKCASSSGCAYLSTEKDFSDFASQLKGMDFSATRAYLGGYKSSQNPTATPLSDWPTDEGHCDTLAKQAIVVHVALWRTDVKVDPSTNKPTASSLTSLAYSNWQGYRASWDKHTGRCLTKQPRSADNSPLFYKVKAFRLINIDFLQSPLASAPPPFSYKASTTPTIPQNIQDLGTLIETISGATNGLGRTGNGPTIPQVQAYLTDAEVNTTTPPPYTLNITAMIGSAQEQKGTGTKSASNSPSQPVDCTDLAKTACSFSRTFAVLEPEYWDVGVGLAIPGVTEAVYTASTSTSSLPISKLKHHTDAYALVDLFPLATVAPKQSYRPIPLAGFELITYGRF